MTLEPKDCPHTEFEWFHTIDVGGGVAMMLSACKSCGLVKAIRVT